MAPDEILTVSFLKGFPNYVTEASVELDGFSWGGGRGRATAGDYALAPLQPPALLPVAAEGYPLEGISLKHRQGDRQVGVFAGRPKYPYRPAGVEWATPWLGGVRWLDRWGRTWIESAVTVIDRPTYLTDRRRETGGIIGGRAVRELSPWLLLFGEAQVDAAGNPAGRLGLRQKLQRGELSASLYWFDRDLPFLYPLVRPGESGLEVSGRFQPSERTALFGTAAWVDDTVLTRRKEFRGSVGVSTSLGTNRPALTLVYGRNQLIADARTVAERVQFAHRLAASVTRGTSAELIDLTVEKVWSEDGGSPDRTQGILNLRRVVGLDALLSGWAVVQAEGGKGWGISSEAAVELPAGGRYHALAGLGAAWLDRPAGRSRQGEVVVGVSRRLLRDGLNLRLEMRLPFAVGGTTANTFSRRASLDLGYRFGWRRLDHLFSILGITPPGVESGIVEGRVHMAGKGVPGGRILVAGEPRAITRADGSFRIVGVAAGRPVVSLEVASLDTRVSAVGGASRTVELAAKSVARVEFEVAELSYFQGSVVRCEEGALYPVAGASVTVSAPGFSARAITNAQGGFQFEGIPPGRYEIGVDPGPAGRALGLDSRPPFPLDLTEDVAGFVVRIGCP